ncbi:hypothetical protein [Mumia sp. Pv 4-285]|uniref:hypothetical protein n=1 Tax=Mumia qirimensis TaxID=3234852 RepID=UPI00351CF84D
MRNRLAPTLVALAAAALVLGGCSSDDEPSAGSTTATSSESPASDDGASSDAGDGSGDSGTADGDASEPTPEPSTNPAAEPTDGTAESSQPTKKGKQTAVFSRVPGNASGECVRVGKQRDVRSGSIVGGPFDTAAATWGTTQPGQPKRNVMLYWVPLHADDMKGVTVTAKNAATGATVKVNREPFGEAEQWKYYATNMVLRDPGAWTFRVSAGPDSGCFVMTLRR